MSDRGGVNGFDPVTHGPDVQLVQFNTDPLGMSRAIPAYPDRILTLYFEILFNTQSEIFFQRERPPFL